MKLTPMQAEFLHFEWFTLSSYLKLYFMAGVAASLVLLFMMRFASDRRIGNAKLRKGQVQWEIVQSLIAFCTITALQAIGYFGSLYGSLKVYFRIDQYGMPYFWFSIVLIILLHDTYFYWTHRLMHHPLLYERVHAFHHRSRKPTPWTAYSFSIFEAIINGAFVLLFITVLPLHFLVMTIFTIHLVVRNVVIHLGYEIMPSWWVDNPLTRWFSPVTHHDVHHARVQGNYALYFTWWDRMMGTEHPDYEAIFRRAASARFHLKPNAPAVEGLGD